MHLSIIIQKLLIKNYTHLNRSLNFMIYRDYLVNDICFPILESCKMRSLLLVWFGLVGFLILNGKVSTPQFDEDVLSGAAE